MLLFAGSKMLKRFRAVELQVWVTIGVVGFKNYETSG